MLTKKIHEMLKTGSVTEKDDDSEICTKDADNPPQNDKLLKIHKKWKTECISVDGIKLRAGHFPSKTHPPKANIGCGVGPQ